MLFIYFVFIFNVVFLFRQTNRLLLLLLVYRFTVSVTEQEQENASRLFFVDHCLGFPGHFVWSFAASKKGIIVIDFLLFSSVYCF